MSKAKKQKDKAPMPAASAGLLRFYEEESVGVKVGPIVVLVVAVFLMVLVLSAHLIF